MSLPRVRCPQCNELSDLMDWKPTEGYDPRLRQFRCKYGHFFYKRLTLKAMKGIDLKYESVLE